ncbi:FMRFamide-like neuropeptide 6 [Toxocara canis]|uniref:FMRFamide-like neuropeptide 6 n=1 Tax=Toxocara canis TaxID=6265 RepID=A0A0B2V7L6_TOXCA|nr:FMRFamide-like neuropeptide 6 [Toxocara canis]
MAETSSSTLPSRPLFVGRKMALQMALFVALFGAACALPMVIKEDLAPQVISDDDLVMMCEFYPQLELCTNAYLMDKRKSAYMRFGRSDPLVMTGDGGEVEKRKSAYMRFGKRDDAPSSLSDGAPSYDGAEVEKRKSAYMRFGKRKSAYMRFGKRSEDETKAEAEKRKSAYMRLAEVKRMMR